ncbi:FAD-dependent oxidoreductase [Proteiniclasticum ruminis]|uniref:NADPH-dependent 2,4-dienoyl-CoA reductase, sulfur reductase n=1 Tax=Proteiniclasticum ruminis TaxID=398199 RepID=A0A1I5EWG1_9CLOT|nr:FAD-dependent oxidoreductase [Proteiniclasticum ruminis]SFO15716.1 NADPH-dependent 2,4-dienoyl-CoA reductase, sulfur reductase [Proteiniclasticum ruminis]
MKIRIIGAVAAGTSAAAKARRNSEEAEIIIYEIDTYISYSGCGMPYYIGGEVENGEDLTPRDPKFFKSKYNVDIKTGHEVLQVDPKEKILLVKNLETGETMKDSYDKLIFATGARSVVPPITGVRNKHVFSLRNIKDMYSIKKYIDEKNPKDAVIIGTGFIGLEMAENLKHLGMEVTMVELLTQVSPGLDEDMAILVEEHLAAKGVQVITGKSAKEITENEVILSDESKLPGDLVIVATGVRPHVELAKEAGIEMGVTGAIKVNPFMETSVADIYAAGDCIEQYHSITGKPVYRPLGSTANKTGRMAGNNATGGNLEFRGVLGTGIYKIFDLAVAQTGLTEREALKEGYEISVSHNIKPNRPEYMGGKEMVIKSVADKKDGRLLGVQIIGPEGVDKRVDVFAALITFGAKVQDLVHLDLAYAPPFSTTKDPVMYTGMIQENAIYGNRPVMTIKELDELASSGKKVRIVDARVVKQYEASHVENAINVPHSAARDVAKDLEKDTITVTYCNKGTTGNAVQNIFLNSGVEKVYNLSGGHKTYLRYLKMKKK